MRYFLILAGFFLVSQYTVLGQETSLYFSVERGLYESPFIVELSASDTTAQIRYTLDGSKPSPSVGLVYSGSIAISTTSYIRALAHSSLDTTAVITHSYIFLAGVIASADMDTDITLDPVYGPMMDSALRAIPTISIVSPDVEGNDHISTEAEISVEMIYPDGSKGFHIDCGAQTWGGSPTNPKKNYRLEFKSIYGYDKLRYPLFEDGYEYGIKPDNEFDELLLRAGSQDGTNGEFADDRRAQFVRNRFLFDLQMAMGYPAPHGRYVHVYVNGGYMGHYHFMERPNGGFFSSYYGKHKDHYEIRKSGTYIGNPVSPTFYSVMSDYISSANLYNQTQYQNLSDYVDLQQAADYLIMNHYAANFDYSNSHNTWGGADPYIGNGGYKFMLWDVDLTLNNVGKWGWLSPMVNRDYTNKYGLVPNKLYNSTPEFKSLLADQMQCHCFENGLLTPAIVDSMYMLRINQVQLPLIAESARWGDEDFTVNGALNADWDVNDEFLSELDTVRNEFIAGRTTELITQYQNRSQYPASLISAQFGHLGGVVAAGFQLDLNNPNATGTLYYEIDGDPRIFGGGLSGSASIYTSPFTLPNGKHTVRARIKDGNDWSASCPRTFYVGMDYQNVLINEIHYHPSDSCYADDPDEAAFIELHNKGLTTVDLSGCFFSKGIYYSFPDGMSIAPGAFLVLAEDVDVFQAVYGFAAHGQFRGQLSNDGELLVLCNPDGEAIDSVLYNDVYPWDRQADGRGSSLELLHPDFDNMLAGSWWTSDSLCGTPLATNSRQCSNTPASIVINEINYDYDYKLKGLDANDWIELWNPNPFPVDLSDWYLQDSDTLLQIPSGMLINGNDYFLLCDSLNDFQSVHPGISSLIQLEGLGLSQKGEPVFLRNQEGCLVDALEFDNKSPWPKEPDKDGFSLMLENPVKDNEEGSNWLASGNFGGTPGKQNNVYCTNDPPQIVINEINYKSSPLNEAGDWVELYNPGSDAIDLSGWEIHDRNNFYRLPNGITIPAYGYWVLAQDLIAFNSIHPAVMNVSGGWSFGLGGDGEWLALLNQTRCWVDGLKYNDSPPWPTEADGNGPTLALIDPGLNNELPGSWAPSTWGGALYGTPGGPNMIPDPCLYLSDTTVVINEIHYNSPDGFDPGNWLELYNPSPDTMDLSGWMLMDEDSVFVIPNSTKLNPNDYLVLAENPTALAALYTPAPLNVLGPIGFQFNNGGEQLLLYTNNRCLRDSVDFNDQAPWPNIPNGDPTIALISADLDNALGQNWAASRLQGTPGYPNEFDCGPAAVHKNLQLWLKADQSLPNNSPISNWTGASPFAHDAAQANPNAQPLYTTNQINGHDVVRFDGTTDWLQIDAIATTLSDSSSIFMVFKPSQDADAGALLSSHSSGIDRLQFGHQINGNLIYDPANIVSGANYHDIALITHFEIFPDQQILSFVDGIPGNSLNAVLATGANQASIGQEYDGAVQSNFWKGDLAEFILYKGNLTTPEQQAIESELSIKYGTTIPVSSHQYYNNTAFPNFLVGIGKNELSCLDQTDSKSSLPGSVLRIWNPSDLQHQEFLVLGNNGFSLAETTVDVPVTVSKRLERIWQVSKTGSPGTISLSFDLSAAGISLADPLNFALLIDQNDGNFSDAQIHVDGKMINGNVISFANVDLPEASWICLATERPCGAFFVETVLNQGTCDPAMVGSDTTFFVSMNGCDSLLIVHTTEFPKDTTVFNLTSCNPLDTGMVDIILNNQYGCDSLVRTITSLEVNPPALLVQASPCPGVTLEAFPAGAEDYQWFRNGIFVGSSGPLETFVADSAGLWTVRREIAGCLSPPSNAQLVHNQPDSLGLTLNGGAPPCEGAQLNATGPPSTNYLWFHNGAFSFSSLVPNAIAADSGSWTVYAADAVGCISEPSNSLLIESVPNAPNLIVDGGGSPCLGSTFIAGQGGGAEYEWFLNGGLHANTGPDSSYQYPVLGQWTVRFRQGSCWSGQSQILTVDYCPEVCDNGIDDDGDGYIDCIDRDCLTSPLCDSACGPAAVQGGLRLWLDGDKGLPLADSDVQTWEDQSGLGHHAIQIIASDQPVYRVDQINGHGAVQFDGSLDWMKINDLAGTLSDSATVFAVFIPESDTDDGYYLSSHLGGSNRIKMGHRSNGQLIYDDDAPTLATGNYWNQVVLTAFDVFRDQSVAGYYNGITGTPWTAGMTNSGADRASIGQEYDAGGADNQTSNHWKGYLAEMIIYEGVLPESLRYRVESYLSVRYGLEIPISHHEFYDHTSHPNMLAGLGMAHAGGACWEQTFGRSAVATPVLFAQNPTDLDPGEFWVWGHDNGAVLAANMSSNVPESHKNRMARTWRISETGDIGRADVSFDLQGLGWDLADIQSLDILVDPDGDFLDASSATFDDIGLINDTLTFFGLELNDGLWFTLARKKMVSLKIKAILSGPHDPLNGLMRDDLRNLALLPDSCPYPEISDLVVSEGLFDSTGNQAAVDWVMLELRSALDPTILVERSAGFLQRGGMFMDVKGDTIIRLYGLSPSAYFVVLKHRNHLGIMTQAVVNLNEAPQMIDFTMGGTFGTNAQREISPGLFGMWAGDANQNGEITFQGGLNDPASIFLRVLSDSANTSFARNFIVLGYDTSDINLDGSIIFQGANSDTSPIFINVLSHPANISFSRNYLMVEQLP